MPSSPQAPHRRKHSNSSSTHQRSASNTSSNPLLPFKPTSANPPLKRPRLADKQTDSSATPSPTAIPEPSQNSSYDCFVTQEKKMFQMKEVTQDVISLKDDHDNGQSPWSLVTNSKTAKGKIKKQNKLAQRAQDNPPQFHFDTRGFRNGRIIQLKDVRDLVLNITADEKSQDWMLIKNKGNIRKTVVLMIPGITPSTLGVERPTHSLGMPFSIASQTSSLPAFQSLFSHACPTKAGGDRLRMFSCLSVFLTCQLSASAKAKRDDERKRNQNSIASSDPTLFLLQEDQMNDQGYRKPVYPIPLPASLRQTQRSSHPIATSKHTTDSTVTMKFEDWIREDGWIQAPWPDAPSPDRLGKPLTILGIDCEMCMTEAGSALTRCTIVDQDGKPILDELVKPDLPITNYLTRFSGITEARLEGVTTTLVDLQKKLVNLIHFDTVLVGHSLECDLRALKLSHPWIIDTSVIYQHPKGSPMKPSLKWLAQKWLSKEIQVAAPGLLGHDSEEDARTAVELVLKKMAKGVGFGEFGNDIESIFERMGRGTDPKRAAVVDHGGGVGLTKALTSLVCKTDSEVVDQMITCLEGHEFVFGRLMDLSHAIGWSRSLPPKTSTDTLATEDAPPSDTPDPVTPAMLHASLSSQIFRLNDALPQGTALIVFTGHDDPRGMARLNAQKSKFEQAIKAGGQVPDDVKWMSAHERELVDEVEKCKIGMSFFRVK